MDFNFYTAACVARVTHVNICNWASLSSHGTMELFCMKTMHSSLCYISCTDGTTTQKLLHVQESEACAVIFNSTANRFKTQFCITRCEFLYMSLGKQN